MCFSASASFAAAALLVGAGAVTLRLADDAADRPFAAIPLLFGIQQFVEGLVWIRLGEGAPAAAQALAWLYTLFSHLLWPVYVPTAVWRMERHGGRKRMLGWLAIASLALEAYLVFSLASDPLAVHATGGHLEYEPRQLSLFGPLVLLAYAFATCGALLLSSRGSVRLFGLAVLASLGITFAVYAQWFVSVWCFLAGLLSLLVLLHFLAQPADSARRALQLRKINRRLPIPSDTAGRI